MYIVNFCSDCGSKIPGDARFCPECGAPRYGSANEVRIQKDPPPVCPAFGLAPPPTSKPSNPEEAGLKLLVDCCRKVIATAFGDGHNEVVLYLNEKTGNYEIHTYDQQPGCMEIHHAFLSDKNTCDSVMAKIKELDIESYENKKGVPICGGDYVCKFLSGDRMVRVTLDNLPVEKENLLQSVGSYLGSFIDGSKEIKN